MAAARRDLRRVTGFSRAIDWPLTDADVWMLIQFDATLRYGLTDLESTRRAAPATANTTHRSL